jgi:hypothetical protein
VRARARIRPVSPHQSTRHTEPLLPHAPDPRDDPQRNRRQRLPRRRAVVAGRAPLQPWSPERRDVDRHRVIPAVLMRLPQPLRLHDPRPRRHQPVACPAPTPQRRPRPPRPSRRQPHRVQPGDDRPARQERLPRQQHPEQVQEPQIRPNRHVHHQRTHQRQDAIHSLVHPVGPPKSPGFDTRTLGRRPTVMHPLPSGHSPTRATWRKLEST